MTRPNSTEIIVVLDRSGSMLDIASDMRGSYDTLIEKQKQVPGECKVTLAQFNSKTDTDPGYEMVYEALPLDQVPPLKLVPCGRTALLDAIGKTVISTGARLASLPEEERPSQILFVIITDGDENSSKEYTRQQIFEIISHQKEKYSWEFVFLGANQDAIAVAKNLGIANNAVTYQANMVGTRNIIDNLSAGITNYRNKGNPQMENLVSQQAYNESVKK